MTLDEVKNCTFEPDTGSMNPVKSKYQPKEQSKPGQFFDNMGLNFSNSDPRIFKQGLIKQSQRYMRDGKWDDSMKILYDGFSIDKVMLNFLESTDLQQKSALMNLKALENDAFAMKEYQKEFKIYEKKNK